MPNYTFEQLKEYGPEPLMRWLLPIIRHGSIIRYGRVAERLAQELKLNGRIFPVHIGYVAGSLADKLLQYDTNIPLLNVLVVDENGEPGAGIDGYLKKRYGSWNSLTKRRDICARVARAVYAYNQWNVAYNRVFGKQPPRDTELSAGEEDGKSHNGRAGGGPEGPEHKKLKAYVCDHPEALGLSPDAHGEQEFQILSGDEIDILFIDQLNTTVVEVKSIRSDYHDYRRGVYQCVKYRAVMNAQLEEVAGRDGVKAVLVTEVQLPADLQALARRLKIRTKCLRVN